jgi:hypothetical protein
LPSVVRRPRIRSGAFETASDSQHRTRVCVCSSTTLVERPTHLSQDCYCDLIAVSSPSPGKLVATALKSGRLVRDAVLSAQQLHGRQEE